MESSHTQSAGDHGCVLRVKAETVEKRRIGASKRGVSSDVIAYEGRSFDVGDALFDEKEKKKALFFSDASFGVTGRVTGGGERVESDAGKKSEVTHTSWSSSARAPGRWPC
jgi:hypothetical protein